MAQNYFDKALADEGLLGTSLESFARSIHQQESGSGKNTGVSSAGARGPMQLMPNTFNELMPGGDINDAYQNTVAGLRYIKKMNALAGGDLTLTAAGYYGGPGALEKAKRGEAVGVPTDKNAPNTLEYAKQVLSRTDKNVSRETPAAIRENIADLGQNYQAAYALMANLDETPETEREAAAREEKEDTESAAQFASIQKQLTSAPVKSPFQVAQKFAMGGVVNPADFPVSPLEQGGAVEPVNFAQHFEKGGDAKAASPNYGGPEKWIAEKIGLGPAYEASVNAPGEMGLANEAGTQGDAVRHMTLMREIEKKYGALPARALGWGHEYIIGSLSEQPSRDREMDLHNNALGLELSKQAGGDDAKFRELMRQALENKQADYYRQEYVKPKRRAEGSPEEGETKSSAKDMLKEVGRSTQYVPYDLVGAPVDVINMGLKGVDYLTGSKLATEKPVGGSDWLIEKSHQLGIADKPTGSMTETLTRFGAGLVTPGGVMKGVELAKRPVTAAKKMLDEVKIGKMSPNEIEPAVLKEIKEAKTGPVPEVRDNRLLPTSERPYVGELERIASDMSGTTTVQQLRGMIAKTGRNYEMERLETALQGLGPKDKITSADLLKRLDETGSPTNYRVQILEPDPTDVYGKYHQKTDNPRPSQAMGVINLLQDRPASQKMESAFYEEKLRQLGSLKSPFAKSEDREAALKALEVYFRGPDTAGTVMGQTFKMALPEIKASVKEIHDANNFNERFKYLSIGEKIPEVPTLVQASYDLARTKYNKSFADLAPYEQQLIKPEAEALVRQKIVEAADKRYGLNLQQEFNSPAIQALEPKARQGEMERIFKEQMQMQALMANRQYEDLIRPYAALIGDKFAHKATYKGQHSNIAKDNPIAFSRFLDVDLPGDKKGMFVAELQSDRYDDLVTKGATSGSATKDLQELDALYNTIATRDAQVKELQYLVDKGQDVAKNEIKLKQAQVEQARDEQRVNKLNARVRRSGAYNIEEAFPGMEKNPQVVQQLMIKNAVVGGIQRGKDAVLFPGADSAQKQLYEKLPNNIKAVLKDLGPGFKMETLPMQSENGDIINRISITWDKKAAERLQKQGVRFAQGGFVEKNY